MWQHKLRSEALAQPGKYARPTGYRWLCAGISLRLQLLPGMFGMALFHRAQFAEGFRQIGIVFQLGKLLVQIARIYFDRRAAGAF